MDRVSCAAAAAPASPRHRRGGDTAGGCGRGAVCEVRADAHGRREPEPDRDFARQIGSLHRVRAGDGRRRAAHHRLSRRSRRRPGRRGAGGRGRDRDTRPGAGEAQEHQPAAGNARPPGAADGAARPAECHRALVRAGPHRPRTGADRRRRADRADHAAAAAPASAPRHRRASRSRSSTSCRSSSNATRRCASRCSKRARSMRDSAKIR